METGFKVFNTLSREVEDFKPIEEGRVGIYTCGPTVYGTAHVGNLRAYLFADFLKRTLSYLGYEVRHVMNITDVGHLTSDADDGEDKMEVAKKREKLDAWAISQKYTDQFFKDCGLLNIIRPDVVSKATDHIEEQIDMIKVLEGKGYTYKTSDGVYFDSTKFERYGDLAKLDIEGLRAGDRTDMREKRNKTDFALWKFSSPKDKRDMEWESPWGVGFPGWHIECSAMAIKYLGESFDIHTGGVDHISIHHTNEIAQSECCTGVSPFVRYWMHGEFLLFDDGGTEKMSKSKGNTIIVDNLLNDGYEALDYRYLCLNTSYRKQTTFSSDALKAAHVALSRLRNAFDEVVDKEPVASATEQTKAYTAEFSEAIADDLNMPKGLSVLWKLAEDSDMSLEEKRYVLEQMDQVFGLDLCVRQEEKSLDIPASVLELAEKRLACRKEKKWQESDVLRDEIKSHGYEVVDLKDGYEIKRIL